MDDKKKQWMRLSLAICDGGGAQNDFFLFAFVLHAGAAAAESFLRDILGNKTPVFCSLFAISFFLCKLGFFLARVTNPKKRFYRQPITVEIAFNSFPDLALDRFFIPSKLQECWLWIGSNLFFFRGPLKFQLFPKTQKKIPSIFFSFSREKGKSDLYGCIFARILFQTRRRLWPPQATHFRIPEFCRWKLYILQSHRYEGLPNILSPFSLAPISQKEPRSQDGCHLFCPEKNIDPAKDVNFSLIHPGLRQVVTTPGYYSRSDFAPYNHREKIKFFFPFSFLFFPTQSESNQPV